MLRLAAWRSRVGFRCEFEAIDPKLTFGNISAVLVANRDLMPCSVRDKSVANCCVIAQLVGQPLVAFIEGGNPVKDRLRFAFGIGVVFGYDACRQLTLLLGRDFKNGLRGNRALDPAFLQRFPMLCLLGSGSRGGRLLSNNTDGCLVRSWFLFQIGHDFAGRGERDQLLSRFEDDAFFPNRRSRLAKKLLPTVFTGQTNDAQLPSPIRREELN